MDYKITAADAALGQIEVTYLKNASTVAVYTIDVPIVDGQYITGDALSQEILRRAPVWIAERQQAASAAPNFADLAALVQAVEVVSNGINTGAGIIANAIPDSVSAIVESRTNQAVLTETFTPAITTL